jgi:hypothetical protein
MTSAFPAPVAIEVLANLLMGPSSAGARPLPSPPADGVRGALERAVLPALGHPPCVVSFSGGRDSSAVLALAVEVARRHGLADPVPATMRFPGAPETDETAWQDLVLGHIGIGGAKVLELRHELDALGPIATELLSRHGLRWPANAYMHVPVLRVARGGSLLTGVGGDELFATRAAPHVLLARDPARRGRRALRAAAAAALPRQLREVRLRRASSSVLWLKPAGNVLLAQALAREETAWPSRWDASVAHWYRSRAFAAVEGAVALVAEDANVNVVNPLIDPAVLAALADAGGPTGFPSREAAMRAVFGDLLPDEVLDRPTKAAFSTPFWGPATRAFAAGWDGTGVEPEHVDVQALRREWAAPHPDFRTALLLHAAWLSDHGRRPISRW